MSIINAIRPQRDTTSATDAYNDYNKSIEEGTRLQNIGKLRGMFQQGTPDRGALISQLGQINPYEMGVNMLKPESRGASNVNQLALNYRSAMANRLSGNWANLPQEMKDQLDANILQMKNELLQTPEGRMIVGNVTEKPQGQSVSKQGLDIDSKIQEIKSKAIDSSPRDGVIDGEADLNSYVESIIQSYGLGENEPEAKRLRKYLADIKSETRSIYEQSQKKEDKEYGRGLESVARKQKLDEATAKYGPLLYSIEELTNKPDDIASKATALTSVLRVESGAAIAESEFARRMQGWLTDEEYRQMIDEMTSMGIIAKGMFNPDVREADVNKITTRYLDKVNANEIIDFAKSSIPKYVLDYNFKDEPAKKGRKKLTPNMYNQLLGGK